MVSSSQQHCTDCQNGFLHIKLRFHVLSLQLSHSDGRASTASLLLLLQGTKPLQGARHAAALKGRSDVPA
jgi:hypothetical protein